MQKIEQIWQKIAICLQFVNISTTLIKYLCNIIHIVKKLFDNVYFYLILTTSFFIFIFSFPKYCRMLHTSGSTTLSTAKKQGLYPAFTFFILLLCRPSS